MKKSEMSKRHSKIIEMVDQDLKVPVTTLSKALDVSEVTIRKDLDLLEQSGILIREHGYALKKNTVDVNNRLSINYDIKCKIAKKAASEVGLNETIIIGTGSTCALLAEELARTKPNVTIITHSIYIVEHVSRLGNNRVILLGGEHQKEAGVLVGPLVRTSVKQFFVDKIFLGTDGFIKNVGFMGSDISRTEAVKSMAESARKIIILSDSSKFDRRGLIVQFTQHDVYKIITDTKIDDNYRDFFKNKTNIILELVDY